MKKELGFDAGGRGASRFLPISTDDEGKPPMTRWENTVHI